MGGALLMAAASGPLVQAASGGSSGSASITNQTITKVGTGSATVTGSYKLDNAGTVHDHTGATLETWLISGSAGDFEVRVTELDGSLSSGTIGSWLALSSDRTWSVSAAAGTDGYAKISVKIRDAATSTILDTATIIIDVDNGGGGGGGGGSVDWANISATGTGTITGSNSAQTIGTTGTLSISKTGTYSLNVYKNGANQGTVTSLSVTAGDTVYFQASDTPGAGDISSGTVTITGAHSDSFNVSLRDTSTV